MYDWFLAELIVLLASVLQASTGYGFALVATPFLLLVFDSRDCVQISIFLSLFIALILTPGIKNEINYTILRRFIKGSIFGVPVGLLFYAYVSLDILKASVSVVILIISTFLVIKWYETYSNMTSAGCANKGLRPEEADTQPTRYRLVKTGKIKELLVGLTAGFLTTSLGLPGVPLAAYFNAKNVKKEIIRSTTLAFFIVVYSVSIIMQVFTVKIKTGVLCSSLYLIPAVALGVWLGNKLFYKINQRMFQLITNLILISTGLYMLYTVLR